MKTLSIMISILSFSFIAMIFCNESLLADDNEKQEKHIDVDYTISCMECHKDETPKETKEWQESEHGVMNYGCYMCHGDGEEEFYSHPGTERCIGCHSDQEVDFSKHPLNNCFDCHQGHTLKFHKD